MTTTYSTKANARRAARKVFAADDLFTLVEGTDGRWTYRATNAPKPTNRGGGKVFGQGVYVRRTEYQAMTIGQQLFALCDALVAAGITDNGVPYRAHVEELAVRRGIKPTSARAGYTHWKQVRNLPHKAGRPTVEDDAKFDNLADLYRDMGECGGDEEEGGE